ncbi:MAG: RpoL/Rpb11 RNA polymerase subunit family protein [Candidatus Hydrothermarchaeaceae archaeon]
MEVKILKENKNEFEFEVIGEDHTFCNTLQNFLNDRKEVVSASYKIKHPLLNSPQIYVKIKDISLPKGKEKLLPLTDVKGIGPKSVEKLKDADVKTANALLKADPEKVSKKSGLSKKMIEKYQATAENLDFGKESAARIVVKSALSDFAKTFSEIKSNA